MSDNRTTELREKLTECGVEFTTDDFDHLLTTNWWVDEIYAKYLEGESKPYMDEDDPILKLRIKRVTPEQAIAATMGSEREIALEKLVLDMWHELNYTSVRAEDGCNKCLEKMAAFDERMKDLGLMEVDE